MRQYYIFIEYFWVSTLRKLLLYFIFCGLWNRSFKLSLLKISWLLHITKIRFSQGHSSVLQKSKRLIQYQQDYIRLHFLKAFLITNLFMYRKSLLNFLHAHESVYSFKVHIKYSSYTIRIVYVVSKHWQI